MAGFFPVKEAQMKKILHILHVEDNHDWLSTIRGILQDAGYQVVGVDSVLEARSHLTWADVVICDGNLEWEQAADGYAFAKELHDQGRKVLVLAARPRDKDVPFIAKGELSSEGLVKMVAQL